MPGKAEQQRVLDIMKSIINDMKADFPGHKIGIRDFRNLDRSGRFNIEFFINKPGETLPRGTIDPFMDSFKKRALPKGYGPMRAQGNPASTGSYYIYMSVVPMGEGGGGEGQLAIDEEAASLRYPREAERNGFPKDAVGKKVAHNYTVVGYFALVKNRPWIVKDSSGKLFPVSTEMFRRYLSVIKASKAVVGSREFVE